MWTDRRWVTLGIAGSLLLNVFLIGVLAGRGFGHGHGPGKAPPGPGPIVHQAHVRTLPPEERKSFNAAMAAHRGDIRAARQEQQALRRTTEADIAAPTFDAAKVAADFKALREHGVSVQEKVQSGLVEALGALSQASRAALVAHEDASAAPPKAP